MLSAACEYGSQGYMAFHLKTSDLEKARQVAERAVKHARHPASFPTEALLTDVDKRRVKRILGGLCRWQGTVERLGGFLEPGVHLRNRRLRRPSLPPGRKPQRSQAGRRILWDSSLWEFDFFDFLLCVSWIFFAAPPLRLGFWLLKS